MPLYPEEISSLSLVYVKVPVEARKRGKPADPTGDTVQLAFPATGTEPATWYPGDWEPGVPGLARCLVGPGGRTTLTPGVYDVYVKVFDNPETPVLKAKFPLTVT